MTVDITILDVPEVLAPHIETSDLPVPERSLWDDHLRFKKDAATLDEWIHNPDMAAGVGDIALKILETNPVLARKLVAQDSWIERANGMVKYAEHDPQASVMLAQSDSDAVAAGFKSELSPRSWLELCRAACDCPMAAYHFARRCGARAGAAECLAMCESAVAGHEFWRAAFSLHVLSRESDKVQEEVLGHALCTPEAAAAALVFWTPSLFVQNYCLATLRLSPEWEFAVAWLLHRRRHRTQWMRTVLGELRTDLMRYPRWAYHWHKYFGSSSPYEGLASHPGWLAQRVADRLGTGPGLDKSELVVADELLRNWDTSDDPYHTAFIFWAANLVGES